MTWKGERQRHGMSKRGILTAKGEYEDQGGTHYEPDEVKFERRQNMFEEKYLDLFEKGKVKDAVDLYISSLREAESMHGPFEDFEKHLEFGEVIRDLAKSYEYSRGKTFDWAPSPNNMPMLPWVKPTINTFDGKAYYIGTEIENKYGKWDDSWYSGAGEFVTHHGKLHHVYVVSKYRAGIVD